MRQVIRMLYVAVLTGISLLWGGLGLGQQASAGMGGNGPGLLRPELMLPELETASGKLGDRLTVAGKEQVVLTGTLRDASGPRPARVKWQVGGWFRLEELGGEQRVLLFDGANLRNTKGGIGADEKRLIDSLIVALPENVFWQAANGAVAIRFLGGRFRATDAVGGDYAGPYSDLFAVYPPLSQAQGLFMAEAQHVIALDSGTLLVSAVRHAASAEGASNEVETLLSNWTQQAGQWFPGTITRFENGEQVLQFSITGLQVNAASDVSGFQN